MKAIECIAAVNNDIGVFFKLMLSRSQTLFTKKFWNDNKEGFYVFVGVATFCLSFVGTLMLAAYVAFEYYPDNRSVQWWLPMAALWTYFIIVVYIMALIKKCKENHDG